MRRVGCKGRLEECFEGVFHGVAYPRHLEGSSSSRRQNRCGRGSLRGCQQDIKLTGPILHNHMANNASTIAEMQSELHGTCYRVNSEIPDIATREVNTVSDQVAAAVLGEGQKEGREAWLLAS